MGDNSGGLTPRPGDENILEPNLYKENVNYEQYKVVIECKKKAADGKYPYLCKFKVGQAVSNVLNNPSIIPEFNRISRNKIIVSCPNGLSANSLAINEDLKKSYNAYIPTNYLYKYAILRDVDTDFDDDDILQNIDARNFNVVGASRLNRRVPNEDKGFKYVPSTTIKLMFEGQILPSYIYLFHVRGEIEPYMQPVIQCFKCLRFGHVNSKCKSDAKCKLCAMPVSSDDTHSCTDIPLSCLHCKGKHSSTSRKDCPEFSRQLDIKKLMMVKPLCFQEAAACFPRNNTKSYASKIQSRLEQHKFPSLPESSSSSAPALIPNLVIPLTSAVNAPSFPPPASNYGYDFNPTTSETHKRRAPSGPLTISKTAKKKWSTPAPNPLLNFNSPVMKEQLINVDQYKGTNGVCLNSQPSNSSFQSSLEVKSSTFSEHSYAQPQTSKKPTFNRLKRVYSSPIFSQTQTDISQKSNKNHSDNIKTSSPILPMDVENEKNINSVSSEYEDTELKDT